jgi:hypothetical protein
MALLEWLHVIEQTWVGETVRETAFPYVEGAHVLGLSLSVGTAAFLDLRLIGATMRSRSVTEVFDSLKAWMFAGFGMMFITGALLFAAHARKAYENPYFRAKMALLLLAGINALVYHLTIDRRRAEWDAAPVPPRAARIAGLTSLVLWVSVIAAGRFFAYAL